MKNAYMNFASVIIKYAHCLDGVGIRIIDDPCWPPSMMMIQLTGARKRRPHTSSLLPKSRAFSKIRKHKGNDLRLPSNLSAL
jgi:hypothetical protein